MKILKKYNPNNFNTFDTSVFGKEELIIVENKVYLIIPVFNLGVTIENKYIFLKNAYIIYEDTTYYMIKLNQYNNEFNKNDAIQYSFNRLSNEYGNFSESESICFRNQNKFYMHISIISSNCFILFEEEVQKEILDFNDKKLVHKIHDFLDNKNNKQIIKFIKDYTNSINNDGLN